MEEVFLLKIYAHHAHGLYACLTITSTDIEPNLLSLKTLLGFLKTIALVIWVT